MRQYEAAAPPGSPDVAAASADPGTSAARPAPGAARERVLDVAERHFAERGYAGVTLRDIAGDLQIRQASLYHHFPAGKEALYVAVVERSFARHRDGLRRVIAQAASSGEGVAGELRAAVRWLVSQPPVDLTRLARADIPAISPDYASRITLAAYEGVMVPLREAIQRAQRQGELRAMNPDMIAGAFLAMVDGIFQANRHFDLGHAPSADDCVSILLDGLRPRPPLA